MPPAAGAVGPRPHFDSFRHDEKFWKSGNEQNGVWGLRPQPPEA
jgi:hypothetical protein